MQNSRYSRDFCLHVIEEMAKGKSKIQICADNNISAKTFDTWMSDSNPEFDMLRDSVEIGKTKFLAFWEGVAAQAIINPDGRYDKFKEPTFKLYMANLCGWSDKKDINQKNTDMVSNLTDQELEAKLKALGYKKVED